MSDVPLKEYLDNQVAWIKDRIAAFHVTVDKADDNAARLAREYAAAIRELELKRAELEGRAVMISAMTSVASSLIVGVLIFVVTRYLLKP